MCDLLRKLELYLTTWFHDHTFSRDFLHVSFVVWVCIFIFMLLWFNKIFVSFQFYQRRNSWKKYREIIEHCLRSLNNLWIFPFFVNYKMFHNLFEFWQYFFLYKLSITHNKCSKPWIFCVKSLSKQKLAIWYLLLGLIIGLYNSGT